MKENGTFNLKLFFVILFIFLFGGIYYFNSSYKKSHIDAELTRQIKVLQVNFDITAFHNRRDVEAVSYVMPFISLISKVMREAYGADEKIKAVLRDKLYKRLFNKYNAMQHRGVLQFQFVFPDNTTFLRMHKPEKYDDDLSDVRYTYKYTNTTHEPISGFEQGRTTHAFRNVFPIFDKNGTYVGAYEVSHSSESMQKSLTNVNQIHSHFLVHKRAFDIKTWERDDIKLVYSPSIEHKDYKFTVTDNIEHDMKSEGKLIIKSKRDMIEKLMNQSKKFAIHSESNDNINTVAFLPIKDTKNEILAYIVSYDKNAYILETVQNYRRVNVIAFILLAVILYLIYKQLLLKMRLEKLNRHLKEDVLKQTKENIKKDKILQEQSKLVAMGEMVGAIAHQWRQPLNALNINIQNLDDDYADGLIDEAFIDDYIQRQSQTITFMSKTIDDFRNFFRVDKIKKEFSVKDAITATVSIQEAQLKNNNIILSIIGEDFKVTTLESEFNQVILNIISNAKDAIIEKQIAHGEIEIALNKGVITISDNAGGIAAQILDRIFEPYFTTKEQGKGTGIGLYMSKMIIEKNIGGTLQVHNGDAGAVFTIRLNMQEQ